MSVLNMIRIIFDREWKAARQKAASFFVTQHPDWEVLSTKAIAKEDSRYIVAVFFRGESPARPAEYKIISITRDTGAAEILSSEEARVYAIRGYK
jgi:hypothetical protein